MSCRYPNSAVQRKRKEKDAEYVAMRLWKYLDEQLYKRKQGKDAATVKREREAVLQEFKDALHKALSHGKVQRGHGFKATLQKAMPVRRWTRTDGVNAPGMDEPIMLCAACLLAPMPNADGSEWLAHRRDFSSAARFSARLFVFEMFIFWHVLIMLVMQQEVGCMVHRIVLQMRAEFVQYAGARR